MFKLVQTCPNLSKTCLKTYLPSNDLFRSVYTATILLQGIMLTDTILLVLNYPKYIGFCYLCLGICPYRHHLSKAFWTIFCKFCVFVLFSPLNWAFLIQKCQEKVCATSNSSLLWCYGEDKLPIVVLTGRSTYLQLEFKVLI